MLRGESRTSCQRVIAVDASTDMLDAARRRLADAPNVELRQGELESLRSGRRTARRHVVARAPLLAGTGPRADRGGTGAPAGGRVLIVDLLPHDRVEYQQQMGHVWLGFGEQ